MNHTTIRSQGPSSSRILFNLFAYLLLMQPYVIATEPVIHWQFEGHGEDSQETENINQFINTTFSNDCIEGSQALLIDNSRRSGAIINPIEGETRTFTQRGFKQRTFSLWFKALKPKAYSHTEQCLFKLGNYNKGIILYLFDETIYAKMHVTQNDERTIKEVSSPIELNKWTHVALRFDKGKLNLFLDGKIAAETRFENIKKMNTTGTETTLGCLAHSRSTIPKHESNANAFNGLIDDVKIFDKALYGKKIRDLAKPQNTASTVVEEEIFVNDPIAANNDTPIVISMSEANRISSSNLVQGKRYYIGVGILVLGVIGIFASLIVMFKRSLQTCDQYNSQIDNIG